MSPTLLLFDIDGTILNTGGAGHRAMEAAFQRRHRRPDACRGFSFGGMTDRAILRRSLRAIEAPEDDGEIGALLDLYLEHLAAELRGSPDAAALCPNVIPLLDHLATHQQTAVGLGTGNVRAGALLKLAAVGLAERFSFGGFGCDAEDRGALLRAGALRGADALGMSLDRCRVVVIGDTPRDVEAARAIGARCVAVATGTFSREQLASCAPDLCCDDLSDERLRSFLLQDP